MRKSESDKENRSASKSPGSAAKGVLANYLRESGVSLERSVSVDDGTKRCKVEDHATPSNQLPAHTIEGNYSVHGGNELVILDIDVPIADLPEWVANLPETFFTESPHGGYHLYYTIEEDAGISNSKAEWGSVRYDGWYALGPGSVIDHDAFCGEDCRQTGKSKYQIGVLKPIGTLSGEALENLREVCESSDEGSGEEYVGDKITLPDEHNLEEANRYICADFLPKTKRYMMDLLKGGTGSYDLRGDDSGSINRSAADYYALEGLYGAFLFRGDGEETARHLALDLFKHYCRENPYDKTGNLRKWLQRGEGYLQEQMDAVQREFEFGPWHKWRRSIYEGGYDAEEHKPWTDPSKDGVPSLITKDTVRATMWILTYDKEPEEVAEIFGLDLSIPPSSCGEICTPLGTISSCDSREYPTANEVGELAAELNPERTASYFKETLRQLCRETDKLVHAYCPERPNGERHVYYLSGQPHPEDARWVKSNGEEVELESEQEAEPEMMTDGGISMDTSEAKQDLERIREAREGSEEMTDAPETFTCPIEGCTRMVIGSPDALRSHVRQSGEESHRHRALNSALKIEFDEGAYHAEWGPGLPEDGDDRRESIYDDYRGEWGPGAPV